MSIIKIKRSENTLVPDSLMSGELAYSYASGGLFIGSADGASVIKINEGVVTSVNGKDGDVVLSYEDVGAAAKVHTHVAADITDFTSAVEALIPEDKVSSVNGKVGVVELTYVDVGAAPLHHVHIAADIVDFKDAVEALIPEDKVLSVNGKEGVVELTYEDVGAAAHVHEHMTSDITDFVPQVDALIHANNLTLTLSGLSDVNVPNPQSKNVLSYNADMGKWVPAAPVVAFTELTDTPVSYDNKAGFLVSVNPTGDGLEFKDSIDGGNY